MSNLVFYISAFILSSFLTGYLEFFPNIPVFVLSLVGLIILCIRKNKKLKTNILYSSICILFFVFGMITNEFAVFMLEKSADDFLKESVDEVEGVVFSQVNTYNEETMFYIKSKGNVLYVKCNGLLDITIGDKVRLESPKLYKITPENKVRKTNTRLLGEKCLVYCEVVADNLEISGVKRSYTVRRYLYNLKKNTFYKLMKNLNYDEAATAQAIFNSDKAHISNELLNKLISTGTIHIATVSGFHFAVLGSMLLFILKLLFINHKKRIMCLSIIMTAFSFYTGMSLPVSRALLVFIAINMADILEIKRASQIKLFMVIMGLFILITPTIVYDISFILTLVSNAALVFFYNINFKSDKFKYLGTVVVSIVMAPFIYSIFGRISLVSIVVNYLVGFTMGPILLLTGFISVFSFIPPISNFLSLILSVFLKYFLFVIELFSKAKSLTLYIPFDLISAIFITAFFVSVCFIIFRSSVLKSIAVSFLMLFSFLFSILSLSFSDVAYITFFGINNDAISIYKNSHHIVISDIYSMFSVSNSALRQNEEIDLWIVRGDVDADIINEHTKTYKIKNILLHENDVKNSNIRNTAIISNEERNFTFKDINVSVKADYGNILFVYLEYGNEKLYISDRGDFVFDVLNNLDNCSVILNTKYPCDEMIPKTVTVYSKNHSNIISPYSIGIYTKNSLQFK